MKVNTPKRRFKGFSENWEQRKLGEHLEKVRSYPISRSQETQNITNTKYIHYGDIHVNIAEYINQNTKLPYIIENEKYESLKIGDLIFADASEDKDGIAKASFISKDKYDFNIVGGTHTIATRPNQSIVQSEFIYFFSKTNRFRKYAMKMATGTKIYGITYSNLAKMAIASPLNTEEQKKIIKMISNIEALVTLHKRKFEKLKQLQKSYLNESILSEPKCIPKRRFKGFIDEWGQEKLSNVANIVGGGTPSTKESSYWNGDINWFTPNEIGDSKYVKDSLRRITEKGLNNSSAQLLPANKTILFTSRATIGTIGILEEEASTNQGFQSLIVNDFSDVNFLYYKLLTMKKLFLKNSVGSTFLEISGKTMKKIDINIPSKTEQEKIGKLLSSIDKAISLHKNKRDTIQKTQKIYLQNNLKDETYA